LSDDYSGRPRHSIEPASAWKPPGLIRFRPASASLYRR